MSFEPPEEFDNYVIVRELGRGQMGQVYLAEDAVLARPVAIKFIAGVEPDLAARQRFLMEARAAARIHHPNVVGVYRVGEVGNHPYIVSELVRGKSLAEVARPMRWTAALDIAIDLARGLAAAHRKGVVHCDIKLANAMVTDEGPAKLVDFGLARVVSAERDAAEDGSPGGPIVGTPDYMAPEVWSGQAPSRRSDVYSFGALLFELIAGTTPFAHVAPNKLADTVQAGTAPDLAAAAQNDPDARITRLVARCLERDPALRFASGEELREALEQLHPSRAVTASAGENPYRGLRPFESAHRGLFFGRGLEVGALVERLRTDAIAIVSGDSGVGKSSLCRAGVIPEIVDGALGPGRTWKALTMVPGRRPLAALAAAFGDPDLAARVLADPEALPRELQKRAAAARRVTDQPSAKPGERASTNGGASAATDGGVVLFVDQLEELVTVGDPIEVAALEAGLARLAEGAPGVRLLATVRADFLSRIAALPRLGPELARLLYFVSPLPPERIRDVITGPAAATGVAFESDAMIGTLVDATAQAGSGGLPLLSFALAELWAARDRERSLITEASLAAMGGVGGALARHADATLSGMLAVERAQVRRVMLRLVTSEGTRVRRTHAELATGTADLEPILGALVGARLLAVHDTAGGAKRRPPDSDPGAGRSDAPPSGSPSDPAGGATYELAHEVLVHGWGTLRDWLDADAAAGVRRERLSAAATAWEGAGRGGDLLWRGPRLAEVAALDPGELTALERTFVRASERAVARRTWIRRGAIAGVAVLLVVVFLVQRHLAQRAIDRDVRAELDQAETALTNARVADREQRELARNAFAKFDTGEAEAGEALWRRVLEVRVTAEHAFRAAGGHAEAALAKDPRRGDVRDLLGDILLERAELDDAQDDVEQRDDALSRLPSNDSDGSRRARYHEPARVTVRTSPDTLIDLGGRTLTAGVAAQVPAGDYTLAVGPLRMPLRLHRREVVELDVPLPRTPVPPGFVYVPAGPFLFGAAGDDDSRAFLGTSPLHTRSTGAFLIARTEVTIADWIAYVEDHSEDRRAALLPKVARDITGSMTLEHDATGWRYAVRPAARTYTAAAGAPIVYEGRKRRASQDWRKFPMTGISARDADRYAGWLASTRRVPNARLCSELEWERAARGADGRAFPTGARANPEEMNIDVTHTRELMGPDEVGATPPNPFGLHDMSGNAFEWTRGEDGDFVARGGSYYHDAKTANLANRAVLSPEIRDATLGMRICATPP